MPKPIADLLEGYTLEETCERHGWTRNRGVTLMRKLRTVFYEELSCEKKAGEVALPGLVFFVAQN